ncbi:SubName: Full=Uncharacterized protein {ECO:0000313/EMBL:CCA76794.1} [Serendipita indica DSM 11827]|nr:SubName: Full=Uncharacterized protein {ECO:0000313/EMBL:CCA76794.1} [Serendipita indica DSM 11827]
MDPTQIRKTIPDLIQQMTLTRIQLEGLAGRPTLPNPIIPSLHIEVYLLEKAISDLKESLIDAGRLFPRENVETTREIDLSLFATSITLSNMVKQLHQLENPPLVKRKSRFPFGNDRNSRKELDMNNDLSDLHSCHNALRMQIMRLDPREAGEQVPKALQSNSILIEKTVAQIVRRGSFNAEPCPTYVAGLWPDLS